MKATDFIRSLGCRALITNDNNGDFHKEGQWNTPLYDYVDNHFYIDHPKFLENKWSLPSFCNNDNPVKSGGPYLLTSRITDGAGKPYTLTEWNFSGPGRYRGLGGIMTGAMASIQGWDGLWRFAYSHSDTNLTLTEGRKRTMSYFDLATDPLSQASDRASICLFLRNDASEEDDFVIDRNTGTLKLVTPLTCGVFSTGSRETAGSLEVEISGSPATVWVSSLDGEPIVRSGRLLLTHITDVQGDGTEYASPKRQILLKWGLGTLVEQGTAQVSLSLKGRGWKVYELDTAGNRVRTIPTKRTSGRLSFDVSTVGPDGGRIYYEVVR